MHRRSVLRLTSARRSSGAWLWILALAGCGQGTRGAGAGAMAVAGGSEVPALDHDDPRFCAGCHADHFTQWSLGVHASAADDPVFRAMNARGQRETGGALADFCVRCHAPVALQHGATTDGTNLADVPVALRGVTCVACHTSSAPAEGTLDFADDGVMRGPLSDPLATPAHASAYSPFHDRQQPEAADLCGACHAVTNDHGLEVERTIDEWRATRYAQPGALKTCAGCHMPESLGQAAGVAGAPVRPVHDHTMPGLDVGAGSAAQVELVQRTLDPAILARLCVVPSGAGADVAVTLENELVGHDWPSGATQDRRAWVEVVGYASGAVVYSSGVVPDGTPVGAAPDPPLLVLGQTLYDEQGQRALFMWNGASAQATLLVSAQAGPAAPQTAAVHIDAGVDRVTARVQVRAFDRDVLDALVASGDLAVDGGAPVPTLTLGGTTLEWTSARGPACLP